MNMPPNIVLRLRAALLAAVLAGCATTSPLPKPEAAVPAQWSQNVAASLDDAASAGVTWRGVFNDPVLDGLVRQAIAHSPDLKTAEARVREARALRSVAVSDFLPHVSGNAAAQRSRSSDALRQAQSSFIGGAPSHTELYDAGFDASWEIDLFGPVRQRARGAAARAAAESAARDGVQLSLCTEVARNYFELRGAQRQGEVLRAMIVSQEKTLALTQQRFDAGTASGLEVTMSRGVVESTKARLPGVEQQIQRATTSLAVLLAEPADAVRERVGDTGVEAAILIPSNIGVPSAVLRNRPDIRQAEQNLEATAAAVGVAVGDLFPHVRILGSGGVRGLEVSALDTLANRYWSVGPALEWPILDIGRVLGNIRAQRAKHEQALHQYEKAVLTALKDVEDAVVACREEQQRQARLSGAVEEYTQAFRMATDQYTSGVKNYLYVLEAERALLEARVAHAAGDTGVAVSAASLYKALGGVWRDTNALCQAE